MVNNFFKNFKNKIQVTERVLHQEPYLDYKALILMYLPPDSQSREKQYSNPFSIMKQILSPL